jgi:hypothetical protein
MYSIPEDFELKKLKGTVVFVIGFSLNSITISLYNELFQAVGGIGIEGRFIVDFIGIKVEYNTFPVENDFGLLKLLNKKIINIYTNTLRTELTIEFENKLILFLLSDKMYESFSLSIGDKEIIV